MALMDDPDDGEPTGTWLAGVDMTNTDLRGANLSGALVVGASLRGADVRGADFKGAAGLETVDWLGALYDESTRFSEGFDPQQRGMILFEEDEAPTPAGG